MRDWKADETCRNFDEICEKLGLFCAYVFEDFGEEDVRRLLELFLEDVKRMTMRPPFGIDIPNFGRFWANEGLGVEFDEAPKVWGKYIELPAAPEGETE